MRQSRIAKFANGRKWKKIIDKCVSSTKRCNKHEQGKLFWNVHILVLRIYNEFNDNLCIATYHSRLISYYEYLIRKSNSIGIYFWNYNYHFRCSIQFINILLIFLSSANQHTYIDCDAYIMTKLLNQKWRKTGDNIVMHSKANFFFIIIIVIRRARLCFIERAWIPPKKGGYWLASYGSGGSSPVCPVYISVCVCVCHNLTTRQLGKRVCWAATITQEPRAVIFKCNKKVAQHNGIFYTQFYFLFIFSSSEKDKAIDRRVQ